MDESKRKNLADSLRLGAVKLAWLTSALSPTVSMASNIYVADSKVNAKEIVVDAPTQGMEVQELAQKNMLTKAQQKKVIRDLPEDMQKELKGVREREELKAALQQQCQEADRMLEVLQNNPSTREVEYMLENRTGYLGTFYPRNNSIALNENIQNTDKGRGTLIHEVHHQDFHLSQAKYQAMNLEQACLAEMHNEISANLATLIQCRSDYMKADTKENKQEVLKSMRDQRGDFYADAIESGVINPGQGSAQDFRDEMRFLFNGTQQMWMEKCAPFYQEQLEGTRNEHFSTHTYKDLKKNDANYNAARTEAYTLGGFDFSQFADDASVKITDEHTLWQDKAIKAGASRSYVRDPYQFLPLGDTTRKLDENVILPEVRDDMSLEQQYQLQIYRTLVESFTTEKKNALERIGDDAEALKGFVQRRAGDAAILCEADKFDRVDKFVGELVKSGKNPAANEAKFNEELDKICTINGVNLREDFDKAECLGRSAAESIQIGETYTFAGMLGTNSTLNEYLKNIGTIEDSEKAGVIEYVNFKGEQFVDVDKKIEERKVEAERIRAAEIPSDRKASKFDKNNATRSINGFGEAQYDNGATITTSSDILDLNASVLADELAALERRDALNEALARLKGGQEKETSVSKVAKESTKSDGKTIDMRVLLAENGGR